MPPPHGNPARAMALSLSAVHAVGFETLLSQCGAELKYDFPGKHSQAAVQ